MEVDQLTTALPLGARMGFEWA